MATAQRGIAAVADEGDVRDKRTAAYSREQLLELYREMLLIRRFEEKAGQMYGMGLIGGFCHLYIGQEAVAVGMQHALREGDSVITAYRDHGHMLVTGMDPRRVMAELTGRATGYSKGKGGSMHMFARDKRFYGGHGIVGACVPIGTGLAFAHKYREDGGVCLVLLRRRRDQPGPGVRVVQHGGAVEAAGRLRDREQQVRHGHLDRARRGRRHRAVPARRGLRHSGRRRSTAWTCWRCTRPARRRSRHAREHGPFILEAMTYRYRGHSMSDPAKYRTRDEVQHVREERDPIDRLRKLLIDEGIADEDAFKADRQGDPRHRQRGGELRPGQPGAGSGGAVHRRLPSSA